jgi:hypothetical protein
MSAAFVKLPAMANNPAKEEETAMIFAKSYREVGPDRFVGKLFNGETYARTNYLGSDTSHRDTPQALLVEQSANSVIPPHFHGIDQFQVVVRGGGMLGKHAVKPVCVHYANAYSGYGPLNAEDEGIFYFTLRAQSEPGAFFFPEGRKFQKPTERRNLTVDVDVLPDNNALAAMDGIEQEVILPAEDGGLGAWSLRMGPNLDFTGPDPALGGGQYYIVMNGGLIHDGADYEKWSCVFVEPPEESFAVRSGPSGLETLILQYPFWEKGTSLAGDAPLYAEDRID